MPRHEKILLGLRYLLLPWSFLWDIIHRFRRFLYQKEILRSLRVECPVISVGSRSMGGSGKTPTTIYLLKYLQDQGKRVVVVTRGYRSQWEQTGGIYQPPDEINSEKLGDEGALIASYLQKDSGMIIGKNRAQLLRFYYRKLRPEVIILEDGLQHLKIQRDLDLILEDDFLSPREQWCVPLGYMRESSSVLKKTQNHIIHKHQQKKSGAITPHHHTRAYYLPQYLGDVYHKEQLSWRELEDRKVFAFSAIAHHQHFISYFPPSSLVGERRFYDHYFYQQRDLDEICRSISPETILVTTQKDAVKLQSLYCKNPLYFLKMEWVLENSEKLHEKIAKLFI